MLPAIYVVYLVFTCCPCSLLTFRRPPENKLLEGAQQLRKKRMRDLDAWSAEDASDNNNYKAVMVIHGEGGEEEEARKCQQDMKRKREERETKRALLSSAMERGRQMQLVQWSQQLQSDPQNKTSAIAGDRELSSSLSLSRGGGSAVHVFDGFLDVGEDSLFSASDPAPWMQASFIAAVSKPTPAASTASAGTTAAPAASDGSGSVP